MRNLHLSRTIAGASWAFFGIGSAVGALANGILADKMGLKNAHIIVLFLKALSCFIAAFFTRIYWLNLSVFLMCCTTTGNVALTNALALHIVGKEHFSRASSLLTFSFGIFQAIFSFLFAFLLNYVGYFYLFYLLWSGFDCKLACAFACERNA